jgi:hypothetical protein
MLRLLDWLWCCPVLGLHWNAQFSQNTKIRHLSSCKDNLGWLVVVMTTKATIDLVSSLVNYYYYYYNDTPGVLTVLD